MADSRRKRPRWIRNESAAWICHRRHNSNWPATLRQPCAGGWTSTNWSQVQPRS